MHINITGNPNSDFVRQKVSESLYIYQNANVTKPEGEIQSEEEIT